LFAKEKKRAAYSIAIGMSISLLALAWSQWRAWRSENALPALVQKCKQDWKYKSYENSLKGMVADPDWNKFSDEERAELKRQARLDYECDPRKLANLPNDDLDAFALLIKEEDKQPHAEIQGRMVTVIDDASSYREEGHVWALLVMAVFSIPLVWYFLLDRLREVGDAFGGRRNI
jgi:hypothetical protein